MLSLFIILISTVLGLSALWVDRKFGDITYEQILFHLNISLGAETRLLKSYLENISIPTLILLVVIYFAFCRRYLSFPRWEIFSQKVRRHALKLSLIYFVAVSIFVSIWIDVAEILEDYSVRDDYSDFYEKYYAAPQHTNITFPHQKRNLVMIFGESFEATFVNDNNKSVLKDDFLPESKKLAQENLNFNEGNGLGGMIQVDGAQWTQAALVSQTCGIPLHLPIVNHNKFLPKHGYLPKAYCLSDVLAAAGYNQIFMTGMEKAYAGVDRFFETHGQVKVLSWEYFKPKYKLDDEADPVRRKILRDSAFLSDAKEQLLELAKDDKPFALTLMTMDTHGGDEFFDEQNCQRTYEEEYKNVYACSDKKIAEFVRWIQKQDFYQETTIVLVGDHLVMSDVIFEDADDTERRIFNTFINTGKPQSSAHPRKFSSFDIYPTVMEAIGGEIAGRRLGLGVSLFAPDKTLFEQGYTTETLEDEMSKRSQIYERLLYGKKL